MLVSAFNLYPDKLVGNYGEYFDFEQIVETHQYCNGESTITHRKLIPNLYAIAVDNDLRSNTSITTANIIANILNRIDTNELLYTVTDSWINNDALLDNPLGKLELILGPIPKSSPIVIKHVPNELTDEAIRRYVYEYTCLNMTYAIHSYRIY